MGQMQVEKVTFSKGYITSNEKKRNIILNLSKNESSGTQKLFDIAGLFL